MKSKILGPNITESRIIFLLGPMCPYGPTFWIRGTVVTDELAATDAIMIAARVAATVCSEVCLITILVAVKTTSLRQSVP